MKGFIIPLVLLMVLLAACGGAPPASPAPATPEVAPPPVTSTETAAPEPAVPPDLPSISAEEMAAALWNKLPDILPQGYKKSDLHPETGNAIYQRDGKWEYLVSGNVSRSSTMPSQNVERSPDYWVEEHYEKVVTNSLLLRAEYSETTGTLNIFGIDRSDDIVTTRKTYDVPIIARILKVNWIAGSTSGYGFRVEGSVTNTGILPLENVLFVVNGYDGQGNYVGTDNITLSPAIINVGENSKFVLNATGFYLHSSDPNEGKVTLGSFTYRFLLPSGKDILVESPD